VRDFKEMTLLRRFHWNSEADPTQTEVAAAPQQQNGKHLPTSASEQPFQRTREMKQFQTIKTAATWKQFCVLPHFPNGFSQTPQLPTSIRPAGLNTRLKRL
jgi:hypothetical protein